MFRRTTLLCKFSFNYYQLRHLCFERINLGQKFLICSELEEHHCPQPWSFLSFKTDFLQPGHGLFISSLKNSITTPQLGQTCSEMESKPHSSVLFPEHLLIVIPCFTINVCWYLSRASSQISSASSASAAFVC